MIAMWPSAMPEDIPSSSILKFSLQGGFRRVKPPKKKSGIDFAFKYLSGIY
jgi:hypothetical protein